MTLDDLFQIIQDRKLNPPESSYTAKLLNSGQDAILKKIGEEAMEVILAAKGQGNQRVIEEIADLYYHSLVLLAARDLDLNAVQAELETRHADKQGKP